MFTKEESGGKSNNTFCELNKSENLKKALLSNLEYKQGRNNKISCGVILDHNW